MEIKRDIHLKRLIASQHDGMVKVVTGVRRCGKSYLLFKLFCDYLHQQGVRLAKYKIPMRIKILTNPIHSARFKKK